MYRGQRRSKPKGESCKRICSIRTKLSIEPARKAPAANARIKKRSRCKTVFRAPHSGHAQSVPNFLHKKENSMSDIHTTVRGSKSEATIVFDNPAVTPLPAGAGQAITQTKD